MMDWQTAGMVAGGLIAAGAFMLCVVLAVSRKRRAAPPTAVVSASDAPQDVHRDLRQLMGELEQLAERVDRRIETRLAELSRLVAKANAKAAMLQSMIGEDAATELASIIAEDALAHLAAEESLPTAESVELEGTFVPTGPASQCDGDDEPASAKQAAVDRLRRQGLSTMEIARRLEMALGEVELVQNLLSARQSGR